jgi:hypothetical protein
MLRSERATFYFALSAITPPNRTAGSSVLRAEFSLCLLGQEPERNAGEVAVDRGQYVVCLLIFALLEVVEGLVI